MKLALGTVQFGLDYGITNSGGQVQVDEVRKILNLAKKNNINTLDTASDYGNSEQVLGNIGVDDYQVVTKTIPLTTSVNEVVQAFHQSLENLNIAKVEGLLVHDIGDTENKQFNILFVALNALKQQGLVNKIGFSTYTPEHVNFLLEHFDFDLIQLPFNVFDTRLVEGGQLRNLKNKAVEIHARSVFLQGLLLDFDHLVDYFSNWKNEFNAYQKIVKESGLSRLEYALNFALKTQELDKILVGVNNTQQLVEIISASKNNINIEAFSINDVNLLNPSNWKTG